MPGEVKANLQGNQAEKAKALGIHFRNQAAGTIAQQYSSQAVESAMMDGDSPLLAQFSSDLSDTRLGKVETKHGHKVKPRDVAAGTFFGESFAIPKEKGESAIQYNRKCMNMLLRAVGVNPDTDSISDAYSRLCNEDVKGGDKFASELQYSMPYMQNSGAGKTVQFTTGTSGPMTAEPFKANRWFIPEVFMSPLRLYYMHSSRHQNWINGTRNVTNLKVTIPYFMRGEANPARINEGAAAPFGTIEIGQKDATISKFGKAINFTDEMIIQTPINLLDTFTMMYGNEFSISADTFAYNNLINGEDPSGAFAAPVIGVSNTTNGIDRIDLARISTRMSQGRRVTGMILGEGQAIRDFNDVRPERPEQSPQGYFSDFNGGVTSDVYYPVGDNQIVFLNSTTALEKLTFSSFSIESERSTRNGVTTVTMTDYLGFYKPSADSVMVLDGTVPYSGNGFPASLDVEAIQSQEFQNMD